MPKTSKPAPSGVRRRDFLKTTGGIAAATTLGSYGLTRRARAATTEITFASAKFFSQETIAELVDVYNQSQSAVHVSYQELPPPSASTEVHQALVQRLARGAGGPDVFTQDIVWIAEFAEAGWSLPLDEYFDATEMEQYFAGMVDACTWNGQLAALPWFIDSGMLYYRTDLLEQAGADVPETWEQLVATASALQASGDARFGYLWQGKQAEVLVCDLVEVVGSHGGSILNADGTVGLADPAAVAAVQFLHDTINAHSISPADVLSWDEEPSRRPFTAGQAAFLRNWSYVYGIAQDPAESEVVGKVGVAPLPHVAGASSAAALGGYQYGVNAASEKREAAVDFVRWMSSPETQLRFGAQLGLAPTRIATFEEPELLEAQPFMGQLQSVFLGATPRPVTPKYAEVTLAIQSAVSTALAYGNVEEALSDGKKAIEAIIAA